jgi:hypothetical protein
MQFVDIKNDIAFRKIFGNENKKIILISFLNAVMKLKDKDAIEDVEILNPYQLPIIKNLKASIIDVKARDKKGKTYIIEMQVAEPDGLDKQLEELVEITDKWIFFIKEAENLTIIPENVDDEGLKEAYHDANKHSWKKEELEAYDYAAMREQDERGKVELAEKRAGKKATEEIARKMILKGLPNQDIADFTGLSVQEIDDL